MKSPSKRQFFWFSVIVVVAVSSLLFKHHLDSQKCRALDGEFEARLQRLKQSAAERLPIGTPKNKVARFLSENNMSLCVRHVGGGAEAVGPLATPGGCPPFGCGNNEELIAIRIRFDDSDQASGPPIVESMYTNCI